ncbi:hypothetical protein E2C01_008001 [Portunus trituberculatus]|uniref:Uncharacterized protein n=1 Tax=Portunus trituberculatus TaxID=210409 RepID=A0A5B7D3R8_PORTR|nr:hypothetical protein [Portunus trituberculatus]
MSLWNMRDYMCVSTDSSTRIRCKLRKFCRGYLVRQGRCRGEGRDAGKKLTISSLVFMRRQKTSSPPDEEQLLTRHV